MESEKKNVSRPNGRPVRKAPLWLWLRTVALGAIFIGVCAAMIYTTDYISNPESSIVVLKDGLKNPISSIVRNGGDLAAVKHVYTSRVREKRSFILHRDREKFYPYDVALSSVLNDLKCDYLAADPFVNDSLYYERLLFLIQENDYLNPFDRLDANQRYYFENIRTKSGYGYVDIQPDVTKIADELQNKNQLVEKYLNKSTVSFIISIIALCITILVSIVQILQNRKTGKIVKELRGKTNDV